MASIEETQDQLATLEATLGGTSGMVAAFDGELLRMRDSLVFTGREVGVLSSGISGGLRRAFDGLVFDGLKLSDALKVVSTSIIDTVYGIAVDGVYDEKLEAVVAAFQRHWRQDKVDGVADASTITTLRDLLALTQAARVA